LGSEEISFIRRPTLLLVGLLLLSKPNTSWTPLSR
jgi:hypothetical protein